MQECKYNMNIRLYMISNIFYIRLYMISNIN